ncbi:hypothetical protein B0H13DRAFT_2394407 [Mycena leptocephala]|nr:hypothetical protein B0H13DRAFT_2394407 [Mycena leptocephala]
MSTVSLIARDGGLFPFVTVYFISCALFPRATVPLLRFYGCLLACTMAPFLFAGNTRASPARSYRLARRTRWPSVASCTMHYRLWRSLFHPFTCDHALISIYFSSFSATFFMGDAFLPFPYIREVLWRILVLFFARNGASFRVRRGPSVSTPFLAWNTFPCAIFFTRNGALFVSDRALTQHLSLTWNIFPVRDDIHPSRATAPFLVSDGVA